MTKNDILAALHEIAGKCGHCGNRSCSGRDSHSKLPDKLSTADVLRALTVANRAVKKRRECREINEKTSKADRGGDGGQDSAKPEIRVRECAEAAQAGDRSQSNAIGSASPSNVLGEPGAGTSIASAAGTGPAGANPVSTIPVPGELCDIDDLPDCLVGGLHQPHCRHAGKTVTIGGNL